MRRGLGISPITRDMGILLRAEMGEMMVGIREDTNHARAHQKNVTDITVHASQLLQEMIELTTGHLNPVWPLMNLFLVGPMNHDQKKQEILRLPAVSADLQKLLTQVRSHCPALESVSDLHRIEKTDS